MFNTKFMFFKILVSVVWQEYKFWLCGNRGVLIGKGKTKQECKDACTGSCYAVEWWGSGDTQCYTCKDPSKRSLYTNTYDGSYPPHVLIKTGKR